MPQSICFPELSSGLPAFDKLHREFFDALDGLSSTADPDFCESYKNFVARVEQTFRMEEEWMENIDFPVFKVHQEQHARALGALHNIHERVMAGDIRLGREVVDKLLPQWFALHMSTMDAALALAMQMVQAETAQRASSVAVGSRASSAAPPY